MALRQWLCLGLVTGLLCMPAYAQNDRTQAQVNLDRFERQLEQIYQQTRLEVDRSIPTDQRLMIDYGASASFAFLAIDDSDQNTHFLRQTTATGFVHLNLDGAHDFFVRARTSYRDFNDDDSFDGRGDDWKGPAIDRAVYTFDLRNYMGAYEGKQVNNNVVIQGGRQLVEWGNGLALSEELDGGIITVSFGKLSIQGLAATTRRATNDFDSSRPKFDVDTRRNFFGGQVSYNLGPHRPYLYGITQYDRNGDTSVTYFDPLSPPILTRFEYNSFYIGGGSRGSITERLSYAVEAVYEGGSGLSNSFALTLPPSQIHQTMEDISAWAADVQLNFAPGDVNRSTFSFETLIASGDKDRGTTTNTFNGNTPGTDDNAYNGFGYINTGLAFGPNPSNLLMFRLGASTFPMPTSKTFNKLQVGVDLFILNKLDANAAIDESTDFHRYLGLETDLFVNWQVLSDVTFNVRYGVFFPGSAILTDSDERHFVYTGVTYAF